VTIVVQGMAYSMGSVVLQAASPGRRFAFPHSWIMIHEPAKWAGWQSTSAAAQHLDRLQADAGADLPYPGRSVGRPLRQIIRDTKRTDFYLDAPRARLRARGRDSRAGAPPTGAARQPSRRRTADCASRGRQSSRLARRRRLSRAVRLPTASAGIIPRDAPRA
jgi:hypothetical protein